MAWNIDDEIEYLYEEVSNVIGASSHFVARSVYGGPKTEAIETLEKLLTIYHRIIADLEAKRAQGT
jgi:hypothetical protein